ncbi:MAG: toll/interleukin-1 receptor domain-containing protein [Alistipes sp.]|nr:toll/interleukin-1 receptor domain-containing protein [Alistipes sp.]
MKYDLFISYSRADYWDKNENVIPGNIVSQIVETLEAYQQHYKFEYFFDQEAIESRAAYLKRIASVIDESKVMLFVASENSYASDFCAKELNFADKRDIPIFQYCIDSAKMPLDIELLLGNHQFRHSRHYTVEKIVQDVLGEALNCKIKPLSDLSQASLQVATKQYPPLKGVTPIAIDSSLTASQLNAKGDEYYNKKDYNSAVQYYHKAAEQGYADAQINLGYCYDKGLGVTQDYAEAVKWYRKVAEQGDNYAQYNLGVCYEYGRGVTRDYAEAVKWYRKAAEQGYADAQINLGYCYDEGLGVTQDYAEAVKWYRKAAEQGEANAQCNLGYCYEKGLGVAQDYAEAVKWYRKAVERGDARAQINLGYCYDEGLGVTQDYAEAVKWYRKAAEQGHADAQYNLGVCYENGNGVTKDITKAVKWYRKAAEQGDEEAKERLRKLGYTEY